MFSLILLILLLVENLLQIYPMKNRNDKPKVTTENVDLKVLLLSDFSSLKFSSLDIM